METTPKKRLPFSIAHRPVRRRVASYVGLTRRRRVPLAPPIGLYTSVPAFLQGSEIREKVERYVKKGVLVAPSISRRIFKLSEMCRDQWAPPV